MSHGNPETELILSATGELKAKVIREANQYFFRTENVDDETAPVDVNYENLQLFIEGATAMFVDSGKVDLASQSTDRITANVLDKASSELWGDSRSFAEMNPNITAPLHPAFVKDVVQNIYDLSEGKQLTPEEG